MSSTSITPRDSAHNTPQDLFHDSAERLYLELTREDALHCVKCNRLFYGDTVAYCPDCITQVEPSAFDTWWYDYHVWSASTKMNVLPDLSRFAQSFIRTKSNSRRAVADVIDAIERILPHDDADEFFNVYLSTGESDRQYHDAVLAVRRYMPYVMYLKTYHWEIARMHALIRAGERCQVCNAGGLLEVHHRTYERRGAELPGDLIVLCRSCHETFHKNGRLARGD